jgi:large subunit ribosomal protein L25
MDRDLRAAMAETDVFHCEPRDRTGTGGARAARREGFVPGVLYGGGAAPVAIKLRQNEVMKAYLAGRLRAQLAKIDVPGEEGPQPVITRAVQIHPVKGQPIHIDLLRVDENTRIDVEVPVRFLNEEASPGLKRGGVLNVVRHVIDVYAPAMAIPAYFEADVAGLDIGDAVHVSAIALPEGVTLVTTDRDYTIATIAAPSSVRSAEEAEAEAAAAAEGEEAEAKEQEEGEEGKAENLKSET